MPLTYPHPHALPSPTTSFSCPARTHYHSSLFGNCQCLLIREAKLTLQEQSHLHYLRFRRDLCNISLSCRRAAGQNTHREPQQVGHSSPNSDSGQAEEHCIFIITSHRSLESATCSQTHLALKVKEDKCQCLISQCQGKRNVGLKMNTLVLHQ